MNDGNDAFDNFLALASLGTTTFLANQAITSPSPSTLQVNAAGQVVGATGGGAAPLSFQSGSVSWIWIVLILVAVLVLGMRH